MESPTQAVKDLYETTPDHPCLKKNQLLEDINAAISQKSMALLSLALLPRHCCGEDHCLFEAVLCENIPAVEFLLEQRPEEVDAHCGGCRPLHAALQVCSVASDPGYAIAELLLQHGAATGALGCDGPDAPLHLAAKRGSIAAVELLLAHGADPGAGNAMGQTPLHVVCRESLMLGPAVTKKLIMLMLRYGANPAQLDSLGHEPVQCFHWDIQGPRDFLERAKVLWYRRSQRLLFGSGGADGALGDDAKGRCAPAPLPELLEDILRFL